MNARRGTNRALAVTKESNTQKHRITTTAHAQAPEDNARVTAELTGPKKDHETRNAQSTLTDERDHHLSCRLPAQKPVPHTQETALELPPSKQSPEPPSSTHAGIEKPSAHKSQLSHLPFCASLFTTQGHVGDPSFPCLSALSRVFSIQGTHLRIWQHFHQTNMHGCSPTLTAVFNEMDHLLSHVKEKTTLNAPCSLAPCALNPF